MKRNSYLHFLRSVTALILAFMLPFNALAAAVGTQSLLTVIEAQAFMNDASIKEAVFPKGLKTIGSQAFAGCSALVKAVIPDTVELIAADAFEGLQGQLTIETVKGCYAWNWAKENGFKVYDPDVAFDVEFAHQFSTLYVGGNLSEIDVAYLNVTGELEEGEAIDWNIEKVSGQDHLELYVDDSSSEDGLSAYVMAKNVEAVGESVWRVSAGLPNGEVWTQEFNMAATVLPEDLPTELEVDYPFRGEVGERFEFKPSERIRNLDAFPENGNVKLCSIAYYSEIWNDPTHEFVDDGNNGAFAFTPSKSGRYGISLYYYIGNHVIEHHGIIFIGDGTTDENKLVSYLPDTIYADASEEVWLGNVMVERFHLLPGEEVDWNIQLIESSAETPVANVDIIDLFDETLGANFTLTDLTGETGTVTYRITASVSGNVFTYDYVLEVQEMPADMPTAITVPMTEYQVDVGETLNLQREDIQALDGNIPEDAYVFRDYWGLVDLNEDQHVEWLEDGIFVSFLQEGRYQINAVMLVAGIEYNLPITIIVGSGAPQNVEIHEQMNIIFDTQYINHGNVNWIGDFELRDYQLLEGEELTWKIEQIDETGINPGVIEVDHVWDDGLCAGVHMYDFTGETGVTTWRLTVASSMGYSWSKEYQIETLEMPEELPTEIIEPEEFIYLEAGETYRVSRDDIRLGGNVPENAKVWFDLMPDELGDLPGFEWKDNGFEVPLTENGRYTYYIGAIFNGVEGLVKRITVVVGDGSLPASEVDQYFTTLYVGGNQDTVDVAWLGIPWEELEKNDEIWWELQKVSGDDDLELYTEDISNDVQCAFVVYATNIVTEGESVWKATATLHDGMVLEHELNFRTIPLPENIPELDVDYPFCGETGERFEFKPSERIRNLDAFPQDGNENYCRVAYYAEIWNDPTHENVDDYPHGAFAFTPAKSDRYGISLYYCMGNHVIEHHGIIFIGDGTSDENHLEIRLPNMVYTDASTDSWLGNVMVDRYPLLPGEEVDWNIELLESTTETPAATVVRTDLFEETMGANFTLSHLSGEPGTVTYRITASVGGSVFTYDYVLEVLETPENIPTGITVPETEYRVEVGEDLTFLFEDIQFADGNVPAGAYEDRDYHVHQLEEEQQVEWSDEGISVHFVQDGRYQITAFKLLAGIEYRLPITIIVGSGVPQNVEIHEQMNIIFDTQYINHGNVNWIGDFELRDYQLMEGEELTWKIEQIDETGINPGVIKVDHVWDDGLCSGVHMYDFTGETGVTTWRLTVASSMGGSWTKDYQIETVEMPEDLPTEIIEPEEFIYLEAGETYRVSRDDIRLGGNVPENAKVWFDLMPDELGDLPGFEWKDNGFEVPLTEDGRYIHHIGAVYNGVEGLVKRITVIVGSGISENAHMSCFMPSEAYYINSDQNPWLADAYVEYYTLLEDEKVEWNIECLSGKGIVELYQDFTWDDDLGSCFCLRNFTGATGEVTYRITARIGDFVQTCEGSFRVEEMPDNLPGGIWLENEEIHLDIGERLSVRKSDIFFTDDGVVPEGASIFKDLYTDQFNWHEDFEWVDDGFDVVFHEDGRYTFEAFASINGVGYSKQIPIIVGSGVPAEARLGCYLTERTVYTNMDTCIWAFEAHVNDYLRLPDEQFYWNLEQLSEGEPVAVVERGEDENWMGIHYNLLPTGETTGTVVYRLTLKTDGGFTASQDFTIHVVDLPENFPTDIIVPQTEYQLEVGETFTFTEEGIEPADGEVAESDWINISFPGLEHGIEHQESFHWLEDVNGFEVTFHENGRYGFEVHYWLNNFLFTKPITITVGTGISENAELVLDQQVYTVYEGAEHNAYVGGAHLEGYRLLPGEEYHWEMERLDPEQGEVPAELVLYDEFEEGNVINYGASGIHNGTGSVTYRLHLYCGELDFFKDITLDVVELPENLPTAIEVPQTYYEVGVGDTLEFMFEDIVIADGQVPENAVARKTYHINGEWLPETEWKEESAVVRFGANGQYEVIAAVEIGNYILRQPIVIKVGTGIQDDAWVEYWGTERTVYANMDTRVWAFDACVHNYNRLVDEEFKWTLEQVSEGEPVAVVERGADDWLNVWYDLLPTSEATGTVVYRLTLETGSGFTASQDFTIHVVELPENLPTAIEVPQNYYEVGVGDTLEFMFEDIVIVDGQVPENAAARKTYHINGEWLPETEWQEDRVAVRFGANGQYEIVAAVEIGNYILRQPIGIKVGTGIQDDAWVEYWGTERTVYTNSEHHIWAFDACVRNYNRLPNEEFKWTLEQVSEGEPVAVVERGADDWLNVWYDLLPTGEATGTVVYRLTLETGSGFTASQDFTIHVIDLPENFPTDISVPQTEYHLEVGETFTFTDEGIEPVDGEVAENDWISISFQGLERGIEHQESFHWLEDVNGFEVTFHENGRYGFEVHYWINNVLYVKPVTITVGTGIPENAELFVDQQLHIAYYGEGAGHDNHVGHAWIEGYRMLPGDEHHWSLELIEAPEGGLPIELVKGEEGDDGHAINIDATGINQGTGTVTYRLTLHCGGLKFAKDITVEVVELPHNLPTEINVPETEYHLQPGDVIELFNDQVEFANGEVPEGADVYTEFWGMENLPDVEWIENGIRARFENDGRYGFTVARKIGNYAATQDIIVVVGTGIPENAELFVDQQLHIAYYGEGAGHDNHVGHAWIEGYRMLSADEHHWSLELIEAPEGELPIELVKGEESDYGHAINIDATGINKGTGTVTYRLTLHCGGLEFAKNITVEVVELPEGMPTALNVPETEYHLQPGDVIELFNDQVEFANGEVPEGVEVYTEFWVMENLPDVEWIENGIRARFDVDGRYGFTVARKIGNYAATQDIIVVVGTGIPENAELFVDQQLHTAYYGEGAGHDNHVGHAWIEGYRMLSADEHHWSLELIEAPEGGLPIELVKGEESDYGHAINIGATGINQGTGTVTYCLTLHCGGLEFAKNITVEVVELPEGMPTALNVPETEYHLQPGDVIELFNDQVEFANGEVPEGVEVYTEFWGMENLPDVEWIENGIRARFENDGRYSFTIAKKIGNYAVTQDVSVVVGTGIPADAWVEYWGTERTVYTNSEYQIWAFDACVRNYNRLPDEEFKWTLEQVSEGEPAVHVERVEAGDNWLGVWYDLLPTGEATGTVVYRLTLETGSGFTASQDFTINVVDRPDDFPSDVYVPETKYHLEVGETLYFSTQEIGPADGELKDTDWTTIGFPGLENGIEQQESFRWVEEGSGFEVSFQQDGRYFFEVHYWINNFLYAKPIEIIVGSGVSQNVGIEERAFFEKQYINHEGVNWVGDLNLVEYRPVEGEEITWTITRTDENDINPGRVAIDAFWDENCGAGLHLYDFSGETGMTTWRVDVESSLGHSWSREYDIEFLEMPENLPMEIVHPENVIHLNAGETYYALYEDIQLAEGEIPDDAEIRFDFYPHELEGYHTFNWLENGFEITFEEDGRYLYTVGAVINGIEWGKDIILSVGSGVAEDVYLGVTVPFATHYINDQEQWLVDLYLENFPLAEDEEVHWTIECLDEEPAAEVFEGGTWDNGLGAGFRMNNFSGVPNTVNFRITAWLNDEPIRVYEDSVLLEELPDNLPSGIFMEQEEIQLQPGEMLSARTDDIFFTDDGVIPEGAIIYKDFYAHSFNDNESFEWCEGGFNVNLPSGRYAFQALAMINGVEYTREIRVTVGNGESETASLYVRHGLDTVYVGGHDTWNGSAYVEDFVLFEGETVEWTLEPQNPDEELIAELYIEEGDCWDQGLGVNFKIRNAVSVGEIAYVLTATLPNGQVLTENLNLNVQEMPENMPTELTVPQDNFVLKCGENIVLWLDEFILSNGELPEDAITMYDVFFDDTIQHCELIVEDGRGGMQIRFDQPGDTVIHAARWIGNICLTKAINVSVVDPRSENVIELWVAEGVREFTEGKVQQFKESDDRYADLTVLVRSVGEGDAAEFVFNDTDNSGDMFVFAQDQLARLVAASKLEAVSGANAAAIASANDEGAVNAVQFNDVTYAYPMTSDNGYFLYYDKNIVSDPSTLEGIIADCEKNGKILGMDLTSGWYQPAFFFGAGCTLEYGYDENANLTSCNVNYASENGVRALKAMMMLAESSAFVNASECNGLENIGALVSGTWNANLMQQKLGSGYAAAKLPSVDGFQMSGFGGYKMLGIKPQVSETKKAICEELAMYLTSAEVQAERYEANQWGPSNLQVQQSEAVKNNVALSALADQLQYCVPQGQYPGEYWTLAEKLGVRMLAGEFDSKDDAALMAVLTEFQNQAMGLVQ